MVVQEYPSRIRHRKRGFILVMCLCLIGIAGVMLAGMARYGLLNSLDALDAKSSFQSRWTRISCRQSLLDRAADVFDAHELAFDARTPIIRWQLELNGSSILVRLMDEQAKVNVNALAEAIGGDQLKEVLARFSPATSDWLVARPLPEDTENPRPKFNAWGQLYALDEVRRNSNESALSLVQLENVRNTFTCWGTGKLNVQRATTASIEQVIAAVLDRQTGRRLIGLRHEHPDTSASELIAKLGLRGERLESLRSLLGDGSESYSLSIRDLEKANNRITNCDYVLPGTGDNELHGYYFFAW